MMKYGLTIYILILDQIFINVIIYNYCTWTRSIWGFMEQSTTILNEAEYNNITSYWSSSSVVIVLLHTALFYSNFEILWKLWNFWNFLKKFYHFEFFWNLMKFLSFEILWKFWIFKKIWNFQFFLKEFELYNKNSFFFNFIIFKFFENFLILWNFLTLISKKQFLCNKKPYCTLVPRNFIHWSCTRVQYIQINTWAFPYWPGYHPETLILARDGVEGW